MGSIEGEESGQRNWTGFEAAVGLKEGSEFGGGLQRGDCVPDAIRRPSACWRCPCRSRNSTEHRGLFVLVLWRDNRCFVSVGKEVLRQSRWLVAFLVHANTKL